MKITKETLKQLIKEELQETGAEITMSMKVPEKELERVERSIMGGKYLTFTRRQLANIIVSVNGMEHYLDKLIDEWDQFKFDAEQAAIDASE